LAQGSNFDGVLGTFSAVTLLALLADHWIVNTYILKFDDLDAGAAAPDLAGVKKGAVNLAAAAARALG
jgi:hypothetical protein